MLQINRNRGRMGADGDFRSWDTIEKDFADKYEGKIEGRLNEAIGKTRKERKAFLEWCKTNVHTWMFAKPKELRKAKNAVDAKLKLLNEKDKAYVLKKIKWAYDYKNNRPVELAMWLNIKTCPYCNMQYTLYAEEKVNGEDKGVAVMQFDHFILQSEYPMFSMSLYNLIPSCGSCNNGKSKANWSLDYHPYHSAIGDKVKFEASNLVPLILVHKTEIEIETVHPDDKAWEKFDKATHISALYKCHSDVAYEVFGRFYAYRYYKNIKVPGLGSDMVFVERMLKGFYPDPEDIEKRPLTKLQQDLWEQAKKLNIV